VGYRCWVFVGLAPSNQTVGSLLELPDWQSQPENLTKIHSVNTPQKYSTTFDQMNLAFSLFDEVWFYHTKIKQWWLISVRKLIPDDIMSTLFDPKWMQQITFHFMSIPDTNTKTYTITKMYIIMWHISKKYFLVFFHLLSHTCKPTPLI
jgi:hypothetical protein